MVILLKHLNAECCKWLESESNISELFLNINLTENKHITNVYNYYYFFLVVNIQKYLTAEYYNWPIRIKCLCINILVFSKKTNKKIHEKNKNLK